MEYFYKRRILDTIEENTDMEGLIITADYSPDKMLAIIYSDLRSVDAPWYTVTIPSEFPEEKLVIEGNFPSFDKAYSLFQTLLNERANFKWEEL